MLKQIDNLIKKDGLNSLNNSSPLSKAKDGKKNGKLYRGLSFRLFQTILLPSVYHFNRCIVISITTNPLFFRKNLLYI